MAMHLILLMSLLLCACSSTSAQKNAEKNRMRAAKMNAQLGISYLEQHNIQRAKQKLLLAMEEGPEMPETWYSMAYFLEATDQKEKAGTYYLKAVQLAPNRGDAHNNYGTFLCRTGHYQEAITQFLAAANNIKYLDVSSAYENAGLCALRMPDKQLAFTYFTKALGEDPARPVSL